MTKMAFTLYRGGAGRSQPDRLECDADRDRPGDRLCLVTMIGGFAAVAYTDTIQTAIIIGGAAV